jgi:hypothetical protein
MAGAAAGGPAVARATTGASLAVRNRAVTAKARVRRWPRCTGWKRRRSCRSGSSCYRSATCVALRVVSPSTTAIANSSPPRRVLMRMQMPLLIAVMLSTRFRRDAAQRFERRGRLLYFCSCTSPLGAKDPPAVPQIYWSGWRDSNPRPLRPERSALPSCATPRGNRASIPGALVRIRPWLSRCAAPA